MSERDDGGPAFPAADRVDPTPSLGQGWSMITPQKGMSLRDYFAAQVIAECMTIPLREKSDQERALWIAATAAYTIADAMLKARNE